MSNGAGGEYFLLICMFCFAVFVFFSDYFSRKAMKDWMKTKALVTGEIPDDYESVPYHFKVRYTVSGIEYNTIAYHIVPANRDFRIGDEMVVLVNPSKPGECALLPY